MKSFNMSGYNLKVDVNYREGLFGPKIDSIYLKTKSPAGIEELVKLKRYGAEYKVEWAKRTQTMTKDEYQSMVVRDISKFSQHYLGDDGYYLEMFRVEGKKGGQDYLFSKSGSETHVSPIHALRGVDVNELKYEISYAHLYPHKKVRVEKKDGGNYRVEISGDMFNNLTLKELLKSYFESPVIANHAYKEILNKKIKEESPLLHHTAPPER